MKTYYYIGLNNQQEGPFSAEDIKTKINLNTMVWCEGMPNWAPASTVPELVALLTQPQQPPYGQPQQPPYNPYSNQQQYGQQQQFGQQQFGAMEQGKPDNYLIWAILSIVLCCWPVGIVAVLYSTKVNKYWEQGKYDEARSASNSAKTWTIVSAVLGVIAGIIAAISVASECL